MLSDSALPQEGIFTVALDSEAILELIPFISFPITKTLRLENLILL